MPHITIASTRDMAAAKALCDGLNQDGIDIAGELRSLTVGVLQGGRLHTEGEHRLTRPA